MTALHNPLILQDELPEEIALAALWWYEFGFNVIPVANDTKTTPVKWQPWLDELSHNTIEKHWLKNPSHDLGFIVDHRVIVLDADSSEALEALLFIEKTYEVKPNLIVKTRNGEHHYFKRNKDTYAKQCGYSSELYPEKIDVKTGRGELEGRSMVVLPPSTNKVVVINEAENIDDLIEVDQDFIDAVFSHNGEEVPRPRTETEFIALQSSAGETEAAEILSYIDPNLSYDDWFKVMAGLHKHFNGADEGLILFDNWSAPASNYCGSELIEYKWHSCNAEKEKGAGFGSVCTLARLRGADLSAIAKRYDAHGNRIKTFDELLVEASNLTANARPDEVTKFIGQAIKLNRAEQEHLKELLSKNHVCTKSVFKATLQEAKIKEAQAKRQKHLQGGNLLLTSYLPAKVWKHVDDEGKALCTIDNFERMIKAYGITIRYNVITKRDEIIIPNQSFTIDNQANATRSQIVSLCKLNGLSTDAIDGYVCQIADKNQYNPVLTWMLSRSWDGVSRFADFAKTIVMVNPEHDQLRDSLLARWMYSAVAVVSSPVPIMTKGVLVLTGEQNRGKTSWFKRLLPDDMQNLLMEGAHLDPANKDSVTTAISHWLVELGELDATFKKADQARLKAFISNKMDKVRRPYARLDSEYQRRTVFFGSVNERDFLRDQTGNSRWWTLHIDRMDYQHDFDMQQVWAEMLYWYQQGQQHWLTADEEKALAVINNHHMEVNPFEELLLDKYDPCHARKQRMSATHVLISLGYDKPVKRDVNEMATILKKHFDEPDSRKRYHMPYSSFSMND